MNEDLNSVTVAELKKICKDEHIHNYSRLKKTELINIIKRHRVMLLIKSGIDKLNAVQIEFCVS